MSVNPHATRVERKSVRERSKGMKRSKMNFQICVVEIKNSMKLSSPFKKRTEEKDFFFVMQGKKDEEIHVEKSKIHGEKLNK